MNNEGNAMFMLNSKPLVLGEGKKPFGSHSVPTEFDWFLPKSEPRYFLSGKKMLVRSSCIDNNMMAFVFTRTDVDPAFFYYRFLTIELGKLVSSNSSSFAERSGHCRTKVWGFHHWLNNPLSAAVLSDIDAELAALEARRDKTRELKQGMMQELLTGRIRLV